MEIILRKINSIKNIVKKEYSWYHDFKICSKVIEIKPIKELINKNILILAPHSDDEWIGCSQLLINKKNNVTVLNMDMLGSDNQILHRSRFEEMMYIAKIFKYKLISVKGNKKNFLVNYLKKNQIDIIFIPCFYDWHFEHIKVMKILKDAAIEAKYMNYIGMYQVSLPIPYQLITHGYMMEKSRLRNKWNNLKKYYPTQKFLPTKRFILNEKINGKIVDGYSLEAYSILDFNIWRINLENNIFDRFERDKLYSNIQKIKYIRDEVEIFYEKHFDLKCDNKCETEHNQNL